MLSLNNMVDDIRADIRARNSPRFVTSDIVRAINTSIEVVSTMLHNIRQDLMVDLTSGGLPTVFTLPAAGADGASRIARPPTFANIRLVEVLVGSSWTPISQLKSGEWQAQEIPALPLSEPSDLMHYELIGKWIVIRPGMLVSQANSVRVSATYQVPRLFMGLVQAPAAASFTLPADQNNDEGTLVPSDEDDTYNTLSIRIYDGTGKGQTQPVGDYVGATRVVSFAANWAPALDATSKFAFVTPFHDILSGVDSLVTLHACIRMLSTQRSEDISGLVSLYNEQEDALTIKLRRAAPGPGTILPVGMVWGY